MIGKILIAALASWYSKTFLWALTFTLSIIIVLLILTLHFDPEKASLVSKVYSDGLFIFTILFGMDIVLEPFFYTLLFFILLKKLD